MITTITTEGEQVSINETPWYFLGSIKKQNKDII